MTKSKSRALYSASFSTAALKGPVCKVWYNSYANRQISHVPLALNWGFRNPVNLKFYENIPNPNLGLG